MAFVTACLFKFHASNTDLIWRNNRGQDWGDWMSAGTQTPNDIGATAFSTTTTGC
jgi:hypothetical protein